MNAPVIVRDVQNNPLRRLAVGRKGSLVYVVAPDAMEAVEAGEISAVGFDQDDVFADVLGPMPETVDWSLMTLFGCESSAGTESTHRDVDDVP